MEKITYKKGATITVRGVPMRIVHVWPLGTVDVEAPNGRWYRVTGLPLYKGVGC